MGSLSFFSKDSSLYQSTLAEQFNTISSAFHNVPIGGTLMLSEWAQPQLHCAQTFPHLFPLPLLCICFFFPFPTSLSLLAKSCPLFSPRKATEIQWVLPRSGDLLMEKALKDCNLFLGVSATEGDEMDEADTVFLKLLLATDLALAAHTFLPHPSLHTLGLVHTGLEKPSSQLLPLLPHNEF